MKTESVIYKNKRMKKTGIIEGELLAGKAVLACALKHEYQETKMYCSRIKVADQTERDMRIDKLPCRLHVIIGKAKEGLKVTALHSQQENWDL